MSLRQSSASTIAPTIALCIHPLNLIQFERNSASKLSSSMATESETSRRRMTDRRITMTMLRASSTAVMRLHDVADADDSHSSCNATHCTLSLVFSNDNSKSRNAQAVT